MTQLKTLSHSARELVASRAFRSGEDELTLSEFEMPLRVEQSFDIGEVGIFIDEAMTRFALTNPSVSDAWLAPRIHFALRLTRRQAADDGLWRWLASSYRPAYVRWRWGNDKSEGTGKDISAPTERFVGPYTKNALSRLWWMAELFRDGPDYGPVVQAFALQDIPNNLFRMDVVHHRPTALAAVKVLTTRPDGSPGNRTGDEANALAKAINAAATTLVVDAIAPDSERDPDVIARWLDDARDVDAVAFFENIPAGPQDPKAPESCIEAMVTLLTQLLAEARVRDRSPDRSSVEGEL